LDELFYGIRATGEHAKTPSQIQSLSQETELGSDSGLQDIAVSGREISIEFDARSELDKEESKENDEPNWEKHGIYDS